MAGNNTFIQARATAIRSGIPGAMFRLGSQPERGGLDAFFSDPFNITNEIYVRFSPLIS